MSLLSYFHSRRKSCLSLWFLPLLFGAHVFAADAIGHDTAKPEKPLNPPSLSSLFQSGEPVESLRTAEANYTFSASQPGNINYVRLCLATDNTCNSCGTPFLVINFGTPVHYTAAGVSYKISPDAIAAYLNYSGQSAGSYNIGMYVQSESLHCSSSTAYCSTSEDSSTHQLCMQATFDGSTVTSLAQSDNGQASLDFDSPPVAYITTGLNTVTKCSVTSSGAFTACFVTSTGLNSPSDIAVNATSTFAYVTDSGANSVLKCSIGSGGNLTCGSSGASGTGFNFPAGLAINAFGNVLYVVNASGGADVLKCPINADGSLGACSSVNNTGVPFNSPFGIAISRDNTWAYVVNIASNQVLKCPINADGTFGSCADSGNTGVSFAGPQYIAMNNAGTIAYVSNPDNNTVSECPIIDATGTLGSCVTASNGGDSFVQPLGIALDIANTATYISNGDGSGSNPYGVYQCPIVIGGFSFCSYIYSEASLLFPMRGIKVTSYRL